MKVGSDIPYGVYSSNYRELVSWIMAGYFYGLTWNNGYTHEQILSDIKVPCVFIHAHESVAENGIYLCAASREQADRAVSYIENCTFIETDTSDHSIHEVHKEVYINAVNSLLS